MHATVPTSNPYGVILRPDVLAAGWDDKTIGKMLSQGHWQRVRRGAYVPAGRWSEMSDRDRHMALAFAVTRSARSPVVRSHATGARVFDVPVWDLPDDLVDLTRFDGKAGRAEAGVRQHRGWIGVQDVTRVEDALVTTGTRTALDITTVADTEHSLVVVDGLLHAGHTAPDLLEHSYSSMKYWPNSLATDLVLRLADGRSESPGETRTRYACWAQGLPAPELQYEIRSRGVLFARLDLAWPALGVWLEFDGKEKYVKFLRPGETVADAVLREKRREDEIRRLTGWRCIRIGWADLFHPERLAAAIREAFSIQSRAA